MASGLVKLLLDGLAHVDLAIELGWPLRCLLQCNNGVSGSMQKSVLVEDIEAPDRYPKAGHGRKDRLGDTPL
jgi:hypothetical protein